MIVGHVIWLTDHRNYVWGNHANWEYIGLSCLQERNPHNSDEGWIWILYALNFLSKHGRFNFILCWARITKCLRSPATLASLCGSSATWRRRRTTSWVFEKHFAARVKTQNDLLGYRVDFFWWFLCEIWRPQRCNKFLYNACGFEEVLNVIWTCNPVFWNIGFQHGHRDLSEGNEALQVFKAICFDLLRCVCCGALPDSKSTTSPNYFLYAV